jgi:hypothetical protein
MKEDGWVSSLLALALAIGLIWWLMPPIGHYLVEHGWLKPGPGYARPAGSR